jgi:cytochrome oxidase assembly protein ShyY1
VYRFLLTPRWLGLAAAIAVLAAVMVGLGNWQLDRYRQRSAINDRIDAAATAAPVPVTDVLRPGERPAKGSAYTRVTATGRYDPAHEILVRGRAVEGRVGFEVLTPLVLADGSAVLVNRGWVPLGRGASAAAEPAVPAAPGGETTVTGLVRLPERHVGAVGRRGARLEVLRIAPGQLAKELPYPLLGGYVTTEQDGLEPIAANHERAWQNAGYTVQWWAFAALALFGYVYLARREARQAKETDHDRCSASTESIVSASAADLSSR